MVSQPSIVSMAELTPIVICHVAERVEKRYPALPCQSTLEADGRAGPDARRVCVWGLSLPPPVATLRKVNPAPRVGSTAELAPKVQLRGK